jgi:hypothetical protein
VLAGCGGGETRVVPPDRTAAGDANFRQFVLDAATSGQSCAKLRDKFIGLSAKGGPIGAAAGTTPVAGRWWVRSCEVAPVGNGLQIRLSGPAWYRVDYESDLSLHQYVYFDVDATMTGSLDIGYDPVAHLASLWFTPTDEAQVRVRPVGPLNLHPESLLGVLLWPFAGSAARAEVVSQGEEQFRNRLGAGITLTIDLGRGSQVDLLLGQLSRGQAPLRPFTVDAPWLLNERELLFPDGLQVAGPFPAQATAMDAVVEQGPGADYALVCARDLQVAFNGVSLGAPPQLPAAAVFARGELRPTGMNTVPIDARCPWYFVETTRAQPAMTAIRIRAGADAGYQMGAPVAVLLTLVSFEIDPKKPSGKSWDVLGGGPDPSFYVRHNGLGYRLVPKRQDTLQDALNVTAPEPFALTPSNPIEIIATDVDIVDDDPIGTALIRYSDLQRGPEFEVPLRLGGATTGNVRVRVELVR